MTQNPSNTETTVSTAFCLYDERAKQGKWLTRQELFELGRLLTRFHEQQPTEWAGQKRNLTFQMLQEVFCQYVTQAESLIDGLTKEG
jgi:hypothetical protein